MEGQITTRGHAGLRPRVEPGVRASCSTMGAAVAAVLWIAATCLFPAPVRAGDSGSSADIATIRRDLPVLASNFLASKNLAGATVDGIAIYPGWEALATWHSGGTKGVVYLENAAGRWWYRDDLTYDPDDKAWFVGALLHVARRSAFSEHALYPEAIRAMGVSQALLDTARIHLGLPLAPANSETGTYYHRTYRRDLKRVTETTYENHYESVLTYDRAQARLAVGQDAPPDDALARSFRPICYTFSFTSHIMQSVALSHASLDVWFPFALDPQKRYALSLAFAQPALRDVPGTLKDNVLHFDLPAVTIPDDEAALGQIVQQ